jgi:hypothetical protein
MFRKMEPRIGSTLGHKERLVHASPRCPLAYIGDWESDSAPAQYLEGANMTWFLDRVGPGSARNKLLEKLRQLDVAAHIEEWLSSPGLQAPV